MVSADPRNADAAWKLARSDYWLGGHAPEAERRRFFEQGIDAGRKAVALQPNRPEGHFWIAANMGALAESYGLRQGLKYRKPIKEELETVLRLDPRFQQGSADRALGRWYFRPSCLAAATRRLRLTCASLTYTPDGTALSRRTSDVTAGGQARRTQARSRRARTGSRKTTSSKTARGRCSPA
jgi:hypothetical protein